MPWSGAQGAGRTPEPCLNSALELVSGLLRPYPTFARCLDSELHPVQVLNESGAKT